MTLCFTVLACFCARRSRAEAEDANILNAGAHPEVEPLGLNGPVDPVDIMELDNDDLEPGFMETAV